MQNKYTDAKECPITRFMNRIGGKWKPVILWLLLERDVMRFNEFDKAIDGISQKILSEQLRELEKINLIERKVYPVVPPKVEYRLTDKGKSLKDILVSMKEWSNCHLDE